MIKLNFDGADTRYRGECGAEFEVKVMPSGIGGERAEKLVRELSRRLDMRFTTAENAASTVYIGKSRQIPFLGLAETNGKGGNAFVNLDASASDELLLEVISHEIGHLAGTVSHAGEGLAACAYTETVTVSAGETLGAETIANSAMVADPYARVVNTEDGATLEGTIIESGGTAHIVSGAVGNDIQVRGGSATGAYAMLYVSSGGEVNNLTVSRGTGGNYGTVQVNIYGVLNGGTIQKGRIAIQAGGKAYNLIDSGSIIVYGYLSGGRVDATEVKASSGGLIENYTVKGGGLYVQGGTVSNTLVSGGKLHLGYDGIKNGVASETRMVTGEIHVSNANLASVTHVSGGAMYVSSGGVASVTHVSAGTIYVYNGGVASDTHLSAGTIQVSNGGVLSGATVENTNTLRGIFVNSGGQAYDVAVSGALGSMRVSAYASGATAIWAGYVMAIGGGVIDDVKVLDNGSAYADAGGTMNDVRISGATTNSRTMLLVRGGTVIGGSVESGFVRVSNGGMLSNFTVSDTYASYDVTMQIDAGGFAKDLTVDWTTHIPNVAVYGTVENLHQSGGCVRAYSGGLISGGSTLRNELWAYVDGVLENITMSGGNAYVSGLFKNATLDGGAIQLRGGEVSGGTMLRGTINTFNGNVPGGTVYDMTVSNGYIYVSSGSAVRTTLSGGWLLVSSAGVADTVDMFGGSALVYSGGVASNLRLSGGTLTVSNAGSALVTDDMADGEIHVAQGGKLTISGAAAKNINMNATGNIYASGAALTNLTLGAGYLDTYENTTVDGITFTGNAQVHFYGTTEVGNMTLDSGYVWLMDNATADGVTVDNGGRLNLWNATAVASNVTVLSGGTIFAQTAASAYNYDVRSGAAIRQNGTTSGAANFIWCGENTRIEQGVITSFGENFEAADGVFQNFALNGATARIGDKVAISGGDIAAGILVVHSGGVADRLTVSGGNVYASSGGEVTDIALTNGWLTVYDGAKVNAADLANNGSMRVSGGEVYNVTISSAFGAGTPLFNMFGGYVSGATFAKGGGENAPGVYVSGGVLTDVSNDFSYIRVYDNGRVSGGYMANGNLMTSANEAVIEDFDVTGGGIYVRRGTVRDMRITGGNHYVSAGTAEEWRISGGNVYVSGGAIGDSLLCDTGVMRVYSGGAANDLAVHAITDNRGCLHVSSGGAVNGFRTQTTGGNVYVSSGATMTGVENNGAYIRVSGTLTDGQVTSGEFWASSGGVLNNVTALTSTGKIYVDSGGTVNAAVVSGGEINLRGGAATDVTLYDGAINTTQIYGGEEQATGGTVTGVAMTGGELNVRSGAVTGVTATGGTINVLSGGYATFTSVSGADTAIVIDYSDGTSDTRIASFEAVSDEVAVTVTGMTAGNTYTLAGEGSVASIRVADGVYDTSLAANADYTNAATGITYSFDGTGVTATAFTANTIETAGALDSATASQINTGDLAAKWTDATAAATGNVFLAANMTAGAAWLELDGYNGAATNVFGASGTDFAAGTVNVAAKSGTLKNLAAGANNGGTVAAVNLTIEGATVSGLTYAGGQGNVTGAVKTQIDGGTFGGLFFGGALANKKSTSVNNVELTVNGGTFAGNAYGGSQVRYADGITHTVTSVTANLNDVTQVNTGFSFYAGGMAAGSGHANTAYTVGSVELNVTGGNWCNNIANGGRGIFGGVFAGDDSGTTGVTASVGTVDINISGGTLGNVFGGGWAQKGGVSTVDGNVNITVTGGSVTNIFGGGSHSTTLHAGEIKGSTEVTGDVNITVDISAEITGSVYARGHQQGDTVGGNATVTIYGRRARACNLYGYDYAADPASGATQTGASYLVVTDNTGTFSGNIGGFDSIRFVGNTEATFTAVDIASWTSDLEAGFIENGTWEFDLTDRSDILSNYAMLNWSGTFSGDTVKLTTAAYSADNPTSWVVADGISNAAATYMVGDETLVFDAETGRTSTIVTGDYAGWGFELDGTTLKFAKLA